MYYTIVIWYDYVIKQYALGRNALSYNIVTMTRSRRVAHRTVIDL